MLLSRFRPRPIPNILPHPFHPHTTQSPILPSKKEPQTPLTPILLNLINYSGALPLPQFLKECLTHPTHGYYTRPTARPLGTTGDFTTSPEISQVFGEMVGVWIRAVVGDQGGRGEGMGGVRVVEMGPGKGTMMGDVLRVCRRLGVDLERVVMVEAGKGMRDVQKGLLGDVGVEVDWVGGLEEIGEEGKEEREVFLLHEFLDALPVCMFRKEDKGWRELLVDVEDDDEKDLWFRFVKAKGKTGASVAFEKDRFAQRGCEVGDVVEYGAESMSVVKKIAERVGKCGGAALIVDYGWDDLERTRGATLRGFRKHQMVSPLNGVGETDLTVDIDFAKLKKVVNGDGGENKGVDGVRWVGSVTQREWLLRMGVADRFRILASSMVDCNSHLSDEEMRKLLKSLQQDYDRLTSQTQMGSLYRVAAIVCDSIKDVPGFS